MPGSETNNHCFNEVSFNEVSSYNVIRKLLSRNQCEDQGKVCCELDIQS